MKHIQNLALLIASIPSIQAYSSTIILGACRTQTLFYTLPGTGGTVCALHGGYQTTTTTTIATSTSGVATVTVKPTATDITATTITSPAVIATSTLYVTTTMTQGVAATAVGFKRAAPITRTCYPYICQTTTQFMTSSVVYVPSSTIHITASVVTPTITLHQGTSIITTTVLVTVTANPTTTTMATLSASTSLAPAASFNKLSTTTISGTPYILVPSIATTTASLAGNSYLCASVTYAAFPSKST